MQNENRVQNYLLRIGGPGLLSIGLACVGAGCSVYAWHQQQVRVGLALAELTKSWSPDALSDKSGMVTAGVLFTIGCLLGGLGLGIIMQSRK